MISYNLAIISMKKFVIIDGNAILHRAWHAIPPTLMTRDGTIVNAAYGFTSILLKTIDDLKPDYLVVAWDTAVKTFRHDKYEQYKGTRETKEQELYDQIPIIQSILDAFDIPNVMLDRYEADDVIGTLTERAKKKKDWQSVIVTGDMDSLQLVDNFTQVYALKSGISSTVLYDAAAVENRYELRPDQLIDYKALMGDPSDNIKGVPGIGKKSAADLLKKYETLDKLYEAVETEDEPEGIKKGQLQKLRDHKKDAYFSKELVTIVLDVPIDFDLEDAKFGTYNVSDVVDVMQKYGFKSLLARVSRQLKMDMGAKPAKAGGKDKYEWIKTKQETDKFVAGLKKAKAFAFDVETTGVRPFQDDLLGLSISYKIGQSVYIEADAITDKLKKVFADEKIIKIAHQAKFDFEFLTEAGFAGISNLYDTKIAAYLLQPGSRNIGLKALAFAEFGEQMTSLDDLLGKGAKKLTMSELVEQKPAELAQYGAADSDFTFRLYDVLKKRVKAEKLDSVFYDIDMPLIQVLADMEKNGILLDTKKLQSLSKTMGSDIKKLEKEIYKLGKGEFNINSPMQLAEVLFDRLGLPTRGIKKTKKGYSTAASELDKLAPYSPIIEKIQEYREKAKLKSTYIDSLPNLVNPKTGRLHTNFNQTVAATGRLSSQDPNLQNIPIRTEEGRKIREAFVAPKGYKLISADYSQIELRVIATLAKDKSMIESFKKGEDIHKRTAANINDVPFEDVTKDMRYAAKAINFGIIYGQGPFGLSQTAKIPLHEAKDFIDKYFEKHQAIVKYLEKMKEEGRKNGYVETLFGRKRYIPEINSTVGVVRSAAERIAINMPIQGTAADILKMAMLDVHEVITKKYKPEEVKILLSVHDEIVFEVRDDLVLEVAKLVDKTMESPRGLKLAVPVKVDTEVGQNWGQMEVVA